MKHKILFNYSVIIVLGFSLFMMSGCSGKKQVEGFVQDLFGNGVEGVSVQVIKSRFTTTTDMAGHYSVDYAPGTFTIKFSKPGYTTHKLDLTIQKMIKFPAEAVVMFPIPESKGMYYIGEKELIEIKPVAIKLVKRRVKSGMWDTVHCRFYASTKGNITINPGEARFIDTNPKTIAFAELGNKEIIQHYKYTIGNPEYIYNGIMDDKRMRVGDEKLVIRTVELKPGNYAWVELVETFNVFAGNPIEPSEKGPCFPFSVWSVGMQILHRGDVYATQGKFKEAKEEFESILKDDPLYESAKEDLEVIEDVIDRKIESKAAIHLFKGFIHTHNKQWDESIAEYNKAIEISPKVAMTYRTRGIAYFEKGKYDQAISDLNKAIEINPKLAIAYNNRGVACYNKGEYDKAWGDVHKAQSLGLEVHPGFLKALREASGRQK